MSFNARFCIYVCLFWGLMSGLSGCLKDAPADPGIEVPPGFPPPVIPSDNRPTAARIALGKKLFFDPRLSVDSTISCASCHHPARAFSDSVAVSPGIKGRRGTRNATPLINLAWLDKVNKDGGVVKLDFQPVVPIEDENEMGFNMKRLAERLRHIPEYDSLFQAAYKTEATPFAITRALGCFLRTLVSANSPNDLFQRGQASALSEAEKRGRRLFFGKARCGTCHHGFNLTNLEFVNIGLYEHYADRGRGRITLDPADDGKFRVPTLRNIALTAPYMHDGSLPDLRAVVDFYVEGGKAHPNKDRRIFPVPLSEDERLDLIRFLESLTDSAFLHNPAFRPE